MSSTAGIGWRSAFTFTRPNWVGSDGRHCRHLRCSPAGPAACCLSNARLDGRCGGYRSEEHTSELQSLMRISYAVFCLKKKKITTTKRNIIKRTRQEQNNVAR